LCTPLGGSLDGNNRWVKLAGMIPWEQFEESYSENIAQSGMGAPAKPVRLALGCLIIRERLGCSDIETVEQIRENPYLQYYLGYSAYSSEAPFDPSMLVHFRKRFDAKSLEKINELIIAANKTDRKKPADKHDKEDGDGSAPSNSGQLIIDATCAPADITHPTDLKLLGKARKKSEVIIDALHASLEAKVGKYRVANRIVSLSQPHIRPIVRSKLRAKTEFGAKISLSLEEGLCHLHRFDFESFNECSDLIAQVQSYKERHGVYPENVHADNTYRNSKKSALLSRTWNPSQWSST